MDTNIRLTNVRLSFPSLFEPKSFEEGKEPTYSASFIIPSDDPQVEKVMNGIKALVKETWKGKVNLKMLKGYCLRDGEEKEHIDGYGPGVHFVTASSRKRPTVVDRDRSFLDKQSERPYAGCYVNASIRLWAQDHKTYGKRINATLRGVQFVKDGEAFGEAPLDPDEEFEDLEGNGGEDLL